MPNQIQRELIKLGLAKFAGREVKPRLTPKLEHNATAYSANTYHATSSINTVQNPLLRNMHGLAPEAISSQFIKKDTTKSGGNKLLAALRLKASPTITPAFNTHKSNKFIYTVRPGDSTFAPRPEDRPRTIPLPRCTMY